MPSPGAATDAAEAEAERVALTLGPQAAGGAAAADPPIDGAPLPAALRAHYEPRLGRSLASLRLHTGPQAAAQAAVVGAHAYTIDGHIVLGRDRPARPSRTLAHEIVHALHHPRGVAWREPYTTTGQALSRSSMMALAGSDYWTYRTGKRFDLVFDARMTGNAEERDAVLAALWVVGPPARVSAQVVRDLRVAARTAGTTALPALHYRLTFDPAPDADSLPQLTTTFVAEGAAVGVSNLTTVPANYASRGNATDYNLEQLRGRSGSAALGSVSLPSGLPADEVAPVQYAVAEYFDHGSVRNSEVDAIVPVGGGSRNVLYTFAFGASNNVTVTRIGEAGSASGQVNLNRIDVSRVRGFPGASATVATLQAWWTARYPGAGTLNLPAAPATPTATDAINEMNRLITAGIAGRGWFSTVYGLVVQDGIGLEGRLQSAHSVPSSHLLDVQDPDATDLRTLELALQTLTDSELRRLRGVNIGRKASPFSATTDASGSTVWGPGTAGQYGLTLHSGSATTVVYFGNLYMNNPHLFRGSSAGNAVGDAVMGMLHELGHATAHLAGAEAAFNAWFSARHQVAPTWYAASATGEVFPEAWSLYHTDPHFLCSRAPQVYAWMDQLATTGTAPTGTGALTAPASCPP